MTLILFHKVRDRLAPSVSSWKRNVSYEKKEVVFMTSVWNHVRFVCFFICFGIEVFAPICTIVFTYWLVESNHPEILDTRMKCNLEKNIRSLLTPSHRELCFKVPFLNFKITGKLLNQDCTLPRNLAFRFLHFLAKVALEKTIIQFISFS